MELLTKIEGNFARLGLLISTVVSLIPANVARPLTDTVYLSVGTSIDITGNVYGSNVLRIFCYPGKPRSLLSLFETVEFKLSIANDDYSEYGGHTPEEVLRHYNEKRSLFSITLFSQKRQQIQLSPFEQQCIGISSKQPYNVSLNHLQMDMLRLGQMLCGLGLFWLASRLAKNSVFFYLAGIVMGICASLLLVFILIGKFFPRRPMMYGIMIGGWTIGFYILKQLMDNIRVVLVTYRTYVLWYIAITGLLSFLICYRIGPPTNPRSQNMIMWVLQAVGCGIVYFSSWHTSACVLILAAIFIAHYCPDSVLKYGFTLYRRRFPPSRRLLTREEYYQQGVDETARSLAELRAYVNSPSCRQWNVIGSLRDPVRFATFANGAPHLHDEEIDDYSRNIEDSMEGDEEEVGVYLRSNMYYRPTGRRFNPNGYSSPSQHFRRSYPSIQGRQLNNDYNYGANNSNDDDDDFMEQE